MSHRFVHGLLLLVAAMTLVAPAGASQAPQEATTSSPSDARSAPRTPWGHPDLQGIWTTDAEIGVPIERPVEFGE